MRELGIYTLADETELIASDRDVGGLLLWTVEAWNKQGPPEFRVHPDGHLFHLGQPTQWTLSNLVDSGRTAASRD